jgi:hypothetical protein
MGAIVHRTEAHSLDGDAELANFVTACNRCFISKRAGPIRPVKGKDGEPEHWDGLSTLFVVLLERAPETATADERDWLKVLKPALGR